MELILKNPKSDPPLRIKRWALRLTDFDFEIIHRPGAQNIADYLSRHPVGPAEEAEGTESFVAEHAVPKSLTRQELVDATVADEELQWLIKWVRGDLSAENEPKLRVERMRELFGRLVKELTVTEDGLVLRGHRLVMPGVLQDRALRIANEGHQGISRTKSLLRTKVWFPGMDTKVEKLIGACLAGQLGDGGATPQPIVSTQLPTKAWTDYAMDFYGPLPSGKYLLVLVDEFSRMPVVEEITSTTSEPVIDVLEKVFALIGIPVVVKTDNGPPFNGAKFGEYARCLGFRHRKVTPEHPRANGQAEGFMKNLGRVIRGAKSLGRNWRKVLVEILRSYRSTPHSTTGVAPAVLLYGENRTNRLPTAIEASVPVDMAPRRRRRSTPMPGEEPVSTNSRKGGGYSCVKSAQISGRQSLAASRSR